MIVTAATIKFLFLENRFYFQTDFRTCNGNQTTLIEAPVKIAVGMVWMIAPNLGENLKRLRKHLH